MGRGGGARRAPRTDRSSPPTRTSRSCVACGVQNPRAVWRPALDVRVFLVLALAPLACGAPGEESATELERVRTNDPFVAFARDFGGYRGWEAFPLGDGPALGLV